MSIETKPPLRPNVWTLPNQLTVSRIVLSIVLFFCIGYKFYPAAFVLFIIAASTDWLDGFLARKYGLVTQLGRILDPFADKMIICGTFIFLAAVRSDIVTVPGGGVAEVSRSHVQPWMAVLVMGRELLVTALRSFIEQRGTDFSADMSGKLKMVVQCAAAGASLYYLAFEQPEWLVLPLDIAVWSAVGLTFYSGLVYIRRAAALIDTGVDVDSGSDE